MHTLARSQFPRASYAPRLSPLVRICTTAKPLPTSVLIFYPSLHSHGYEASWVAGLGEVTNLGTLNIVINAEWFITELPS